MTEPQANQQPYAGIPGPGGTYPPPQQQGAYGAQNPYGAQNNQYGQQPAQPQYGGQAPQQPYGQQPAYGQQQPAYGQQPYPQAPAPQAPAYGAQNPYAEQQAPQAPQNPYAAPPQTPPPYGAQNPYGGQPQNPYGASAPTPPGKKSVRSSMLAIRVGVFVVIAIIALVVKFGFTSKPATRDNSGDINKKGTLDALSIKTGDCFQNPSSMDNISSVTAVPCAQPHTAQIYASVAYPTFVAVAPSGDDVKTNAGPLCDKALQDKVDTSKVPQNAQEGFFWPQGTAWMASDHSIMCAVINDTAFNGSVIK